MSQRKRIEVLPDDIQASNFFIEYPPGKGNRAEFREISDDNLFRARAIVQKYHVVIWQIKPGLFRANCLEIPSRFAKAKTVEECHRLIRLVMQFYVAAFLQMEFDPPKPVVWPKKVRTVNADKLKAELGIK